MSHRIDRFASRGFLVDEANGEPARGAMLVGSQGVRCGATAQTVRLRWLVSFIFHITARPMMP